MPPFALTVLKVAFLALLYFFVYRAIRSVALDLRTAGPAAPAPGRPSAPRQSATSAKSKPPRSILVTDERGAKIMTKGLDGSVQIGRGESCHVKLSDTYVSTAHARIFDKNGSWYVEDLGSTNGTYLNQRRITAPAEVHAGDRVKVGKTTLELRR